MVQFLSIIFFWISTIFVGFFKRSRFFVSPCTNVTLVLSGLLSIQLMHNSIALKECQNLH
jgi:hypothetical protein